MSKARSLGQQAPVKFMMKVSKKQSMKSTSFQEKPSAKVDFIRNAREEVPISRYSSR